MVDEIIQLEGERVTLEDGRDAYAVYDMYPDLLIECPHNFFWTPDNIPTLEPKSDESGDMRAVYAITLHEKEGESLEEARRTTMGQLREARNTLLDKSDYIVLTSYESGTPVAPEWVTYRQRLRDLPETVDVFSIVWPTSPDA